VLEVVAEGEDPAGVAAEVPADRWATPEDLQRLLALHVEQAAAVARADRDGAGALLAGDIGRGPPVVLEDPLDRAAGRLGGDAQEVGDAVDDLVLGIGALLDGLAIGARRRRAGADAAGRVAG